MANFHSIAGHHAWTWTSHSSHSDIGSMHLGFVQIAYTLNPPAVLSQRCFIDTTSWMTDLTSISFFLFLALKLSLALSSYIALLLLNTLNWRNGRITCFLVAFFSKMRCPFTTSALGRWTQVCAQLELILLASSLRNRWLLGLFVWWILLMLADEDPRFRFIQGCLWGSGGSRYH